jgi:ankyrin repeat protein
MSALHWAVLDGDVAAALRSIAQGDDLNAQDRDGRTPLFQSIVDGNVAIVSHLIQAGANVNAQDRALRTPLHFAAQENRVGLAELLLKHGAQVDAQDVYGNTPLSTAVLYSRGRGEMIDLLLAHSADRALRNKHGVSPEQLAKTIANYDIAKFFGPKL